MDACPSAKFCGPPSWSSPFRRICFQPPYSTQCSEPQVNCISTYATRTGCLFNEECRTVDGKQGTCVNGQCSTYNYQAPQAIGQASYEDVARYAQAMTGKPLDANMPRCNSDLITVMKDGRREVVCPISIDTSVLPQCTNCLKTVWQCQRFKGVDDKKYAQCKALEDCMVQNITFPNGTTQANGVKMTPQCVAAAQVALKQCEPRCASCRSGFC